MLANHIWNRESGLIISKFNFQGLSAKCLNICCVEDSTEPIQPRSKSILEKTPQTSGAGKNLRAKTFQVNW